MSGPIEKGVWLGVDVGTVRVGIARSDPGAILASPLTTLQRDPKGNRDVAELAGLVAECGAVGVVVGMPRTLRDRAGSSAELALAYMRLLEERIGPVPVHSVDERLTTVSAQRKLHQSGVRGSRSVRAIIDQAAAVELLQHWLDTHFG